MIFACLTSRRSQVRALHRPCRRLRSWPTRWLRTRLPRTPLSSSPIERARVVLTLVHGGWAAAAPVPPGARHVSYCAGPARALYGQQDHYLRAYPAPARPFLRAALPALRAHYRGLMGRPDRLLTNSLGSAAALERLVGRRAEVVHPPVRVDFFTPSPGPREHFLAVARVTPQ